MTERAPGEPSVRVQRMEPIHLSTIGIRLIALYLVAQGISAIPDAHLFLTAYEPTGRFEIFSYGSVLTAIFSPAIVGILSWLSAPKLSKYIISTNPPSGDNQELNIAQFQTIAVTLVGIYLLASSLPYVISIHYQLYHNTIEINGESTLNLSILASAIAADLKALFGIALLLGSNQISRLISKLRNIGTN